MSFIPQSFVEDLLSRIDIVDIINSRIPLRKSGRNYMACCPFHQEKTPSFSVVPDKQFFNCFGCGMAGSAIKFVMAFDNIDFVTSVEKLSASVGMEIPRENDSINNNKNNYKLYYEILAKIAEYYRSNLNNNQLILNYLQKRLIDPDISNFFSLGYSLDGWDNLSKLKIFGNADNADITDVLEQVGLWINKTSNKSNQDNQDIKDNLDTKYKGYDRFRNRLMFPIRDLKGQVIGFGGRVLDDSKPKYLNSPETVLFHKSAELYGLYEAMKLSSQNKTKITKFVIVEGYIDVIALFQHGINYAVATLGTASSYRHLSKLFKYCEEVVYCFDGDAAGRAAAWRALENSLSALYDGRKIKFLFLPSDHDPDSYIHQYGKHDFEEKLQDAVSLTDYLFSHQESLLGIDGLSTIEGRVRFVNLCKPLLNKIPDGAYRTIIETDLARRCNLSPMSLQKILDQNDSKDYKQPFMANNINNNINNNLSGITNQTYKLRSKLSLWHKACFLLVHNPSFTEHIREDLINNNINNKDPAALVFINIYKLLSNVKTIAELIDYLVNDINNNINYLNYVDLKSIIIDMLSTDPIISDDMAEIEFKDILKSIDKSQVNNEMDSLKAKVDAYGMASLTSAEKQRLGALLLENAR